MATKREVERKYDVPEGFRLPDLSRVDGLAAIDPPREHRLDAVYYDTTDLSLAQRRTTLRRRMGGDDAGWHLKQPAGRGERSETQAPLGDPHTPPAEVVEPVQDLLNGEAPRPVARVRTRRTERAVRDANGRVLALVADDVVSSQTPGEWALLQRWREIEVELVDGDDAVLDAIDEALRGAGATPSGSASKLARALGDRLPPSSAAVVAAAVASDDDADASASAEGNAAPPAEVPPLTAYLWAQSEAIAANEPGVRAGEVEAVHDMRVATRRLRSTLRTFAAVLDPSVVEGLDEELKWLAAALGQVRDLDVLADRLAAEVAGLPEDLVVGGPVADRIRERLAAEEAVARKDLAAALDSDRFATLARSVARLAEDGPAESIKPERLRRLARKAVRRADRRLDTAVEEPEEAGHDGLVTTHRDELLHDARKAYKRARYAVEVVMPAEGAPARRLVKRLTGLQDVLGAHQDAHTTTERVRSLAQAAAANGEDTFTYGLLFARQRQAGVRSLADLPAARERASASTVRDWLEA